MRFVCKSLLTASVACCATDAVAVPRKVLAENFTATWCTPYCEQVAEGMMLLMEEFPDSFIGMQIHGADDYATAWGDSRFEFYNLTGFPGVWVDGVQSLIGSFGTPEANYNQLRELYMSRQNAPTDVTLLVCGTAVGSDTYAISIDVGIETTGSSKEMLIYCAQVIQDYPDSDSYNYACFMQSEIQQVYLPTGSSLEVDFTFILNSESVARLNDVEFIVWAQSTSSSSPSEVYQTARHHLNFEDPQIDQFIVGPFGHFVTIQEAIMACGNGDTIKVTPGTYYENIDIGNREITIESTGGPDVTFIDGASSGTVAHIGCMPTSTTILRGFTIQNGFASNGGGIYTDGSPSIINCVVRDNNAELGGGLFHLQNGTEGPHISSTRFCDNTSENIVGDWIDEGENTFLTSCDGQCVTDINFDGIVNVTDLLAVIDSWGICSSCLEDINESGIVDVTDLLLVVGSWGPCE